MNKEVFIRINDIDMLKVFASVVNSFESDINIYHGAGYYDAKSIMAVLAIDTSQGRKIEIVSDDEIEIERFIKEMEAFKYEI